MYIRQFRYFVGDFETTTYKGQTYTEVWASGLVEMYTEDCIIHNSINDTFNYLANLKDNVVVYYHNLKFDGNFWLPYLMNVLKFQQAYNKENDIITWQEEKEMKNNTFKYSISSLGAWYTIIIKVNNKIIEIRDSYKLIPFSVKSIGDSFKTKHRKLDMEYVGFRHAGGVITADEEQYLKNDLLVVKEALEIMYNDGHKKLTIGACCLAEFKSGYHKDDYKQMFPDLTDILIDSKLYKYNTADEYIRKSYKGGWCYVVEGKENKVFENGGTYDVNSLYPSVMHSMSGNVYPVNKPTFWKGNYIPQDIIEQGYYFFVRIKTRFYLKDGYLPFIQIKNNLLYLPNKCLVTSDVYDWETGKYCRYYVDLDGNRQPAIVELTLTQTDYQLFLEHYEVEDFEILDGCYFVAEKGIFDNYINKYKKIKQENKGAIRQEAKLFLNNLYGKMASSDNSSFKIAYTKDDKSIGFINVEEHNKKSGYIAIGSAITSYAREFTIRTAQKNYYGKDKSGFIYADTDSIHCDLPADKIKGVQLHDTEFCCWKHESEWDKAIFTRQKTYIEHIVKADGVDIEPFYDVKCAGMPQKCKDLFVKSLEYNEDMDLSMYNEEEQNFIKQKRTIEDFKIGLVVPSKLMPKRINGGVVLQDTTFQMR